ncbi:MAG: exonuclease domain-containing protein [Chloroflexota bacterium]|nr:exonuclease domain-containing protein [Chloroflexota bacterium]MDE2895902.1 exonuclease domain-containing protein [Chloroflexota bacterium]
MTDPIYAAIDLEMTGLKAGFDEIIEVGIVRCTPDHVLERWSSLVRPLEMPPLRVQRMTGITPAMLADAPPWAEIEEQARNLLDGATLIGHNVPFDQRFLEAAGIDVPEPSIDTLPLAQIVDPGAPSHRLGSLCDRYGIELLDGHRALADAEAARALLLSLRKRFEDLPLAARDALSEVADAGNLFWAPGRVLREWSLETPRTTAAVRARRREPHRPLEPIELPSGSLADLTAQAFASMPDDEFERRDEQLDMARDVAETLQHGGTLIVEAGTGTGKSLAYLVPAALWALKTGNTVIVSTHTINLQQQLEGKDVEFARQLIAGVSAEAADALKSTVVKGRDNYLCQERLDRELRRANDWEDPLLLARSSVWRSMTDRGDRAELRLPTPMHRQWEKLSARNTGCLSDRSCEYAMNGTCFLLRVQREAAGSHITIANHALLVRALVGGAITVPDGAVVIIDESHALEEVATDQLSLEMSESWMMEAVMQVADGADSLADEARRIGLGSLSEQIRQRAAQAEMSLARLFEDVAAFATEYAQDRRGSEDRVTLSRGARNTKSWSELELVWERAQEDLSLLAAAVEDVAEQCRASDSTISEEQESKRQSVAADAQSMLDDLRERMGQLGRAVTEHSIDVIAWVARETRRSEKASVHAAPLSVASYLQPLWNERHATVLTGATLATSAQENSAFDYLRERLGIEDADESQYGSPFDYERHCRIYLPTDILDADDSEHNESVANAIKTLAIAAGGRTMVLFRSYSAMNQVTRRLRQGLEEAGLVLLRQGRDGSAATIVEALRADPRSVAFGVAALWTGVDIPGDALSLLIMTRLPFAPPNDPVLKARGEQYDNEFMEFSLPAAVLQFRQGIGRLIRTQSDLGAAVILDGRVVNRRYGKHFLDALPPAPIVRTPLNAIAEDLRSFLPPIGPSP